MRLTSILVVAALLSSQALGDVIITQGTSAPAYTVTLDFDEPGGPTGQIDTDAFLDSHGITEIQSGDQGVRMVMDPADYGYVWAGGDNVFYAPWGSYLTFENELTEFSTQAWDSSGPGMMGGMGVYAYLGDVEVGSLFVEDPPWGGIGDEWFNIATTDGSTFDHVRLVGFGWVGPESMLDNMSWNVIPEPGSLALLGLGLLTVLRRR